MIKHMPEIEQLHARLLQALQRLEIVEWLRTHAPNQHAIPGQVLRAAYARDLAGAQAGLPSVVGLAHDARLDMAQMGTFGPAALAYDTLHAIADFVAIIFAPSLRDRALTRCAEFLTEVEAH